MLGLAFYLFSPTCLINSIKHEHSCKILYLNCLSDWAKPYRGTSRYSIIGVLICSNDCGLENRLLTLCRLDGFSSHTYSNNTYVIAHFVVQGDHRHNLLNYDVFLSLKDVLF